MIAHLKAIGSRVSCSCCPQLAQPAAPANHSGFLVVEKKALVACSQKSPLQADSILPNRFYCLYLGQSIFRDDSYACC